MLQTSVPQTDTCNLQPDNPIMAQDTSRSAARARRTTNTVSRQQANGTEGCVRADMHLTQFQVLCVLLADCFCEDKTKRFHHVAANQLRQHLCWLALWI